MIDGSQTLSIHGPGVRGGTVMVSDFRDAMGYSKQAPLPARKVAGSGVVKLAESTATIKTTGVVDGNLISGLAATDGLVGALVTGAGIPPDTTVTKVLVPSAPGKQGKVQMSNEPPFPPTTSVPQPLVFVVTIRQSTISGLASTDGLVGASVSGPGIPPGAVVTGIKTPAVAPTNLEPGTPGEVVISFAPPEEAKPGWFGTKPTPADPAAPPVPRPPPPAAVLTPVDVAFDIPPTSIVIPDGVSMLILSPVDPIADLVVKMPAHPVDGQFVYIFSTLAIGALTLLPNTGQQIHLSPAPPPPKDPPGPPPSLALAADTRVGYLYSAGNATWDRIQ